MWATIVRSNPEMVAFFEVQESRFHRIFANINGFKLGYRIMRFVNGCHLGRLYKGIMLAACALDADNHLFSFSYAIVSSENVENLV